MLYYIVFLKRPRTFAFGPLRVKIYFVASTPVYLLINSFEEVIIDQTHVICHQTINEQNNCQQDYLKKL